MNAKQAKRARAAANHEANRRGLWKKGEADIYAKWWRRLLARFFPKLRKKYADWIGTWYKRTLKDWARQAYRSIHDQDWKAFQCLQAKRERARRRVASKVKEYEGHDIPPGINPAKQA